MIWEDHELAGVAGARVAQRAGSLGTRRLVRQRSRMSPEASQIQRGTRRQHWSPARNVHPTILPLRLRVDHVFAVLYWNAATACRTLTRCERRFRPPDHFANIPSASKFVRHLLPPHGRPGEGRPPTRGLVDIGRPSGLFPQGDAVGGGQLPSFLVVDVRSRSCVHEQSLKPGMRGRSRMYVDRHAG
jgi:hypothetical protein